MGFLDKFKNKFGSQGKPQKEAKEKPKAEIKSEEKKELKPKSSLKPKIEGQAVKSEAAAKKAKKEESKDAYRILLKPLVTEKATNLVSQNKYSFMVAKSTNKIEVRKAIIALYGLKPVNINIVNAKGKFVRTGRTEGKKKNWKKAIVTLKSGDKIEIYEGV